MSDVPEQKNPPCATFDTTLLPDKHHLYASDAVTDGDVTKEARVNYEQTIREAMRSARDDNDDEVLDWRTMNVMATVRVIVEHKVTLEGAVLQEVRHGSDVKADQLDKDLTEYEVSPVRLVNLCTDKKHTASDC